MEENNNQEMEELELTQEELEAEEAIELPDREAMSVIAPVYPIPITVAAGIQPISPPHDTLPIEQPE